MKKVETQKCISCERSKQYLPTPWTGEGGCGL